MKVSSLIVALLFVIMVTATFGMFFADVSDNYGGNFNNQTFSDYDKLQDIKNTSQQINESLLELKETENPGVLTFANAFISSGWTVLRTTFASVDIMTDVVTKGFTDSKISDGANFILPILLLIVFILFAFAVVSVLVGREI